MLLQFTRVLFHNGNKGTEIKKNKTNFSTFQHKIKQICLTKISWKIYEKEFFRTDRIQKILSPMILSESHS